MHSECTASRDRGTNSLAPAVIHAAVTRAKSYTHIASPLVYHDVVAALFTGTNEGLVGGNHRCLASSWVCHQKD
eukprot:scaffold255177_cov19-Prasinocladus_malaysianus.AAC.1